jgi:hypothetical protein
MKDILKRLASLVIEVPDDAPVPSSTYPSHEDEPEPPPTKRKTIAELVREAEGPNLEDVHVNVSPAPAAPPAGAPSAPIVAAGPLISADGQVDVQAIYAKANLPASPFTAEQAFEMLQGLPAELPLDTKKQMAKVMLGAMGKTLGVNAETVVTDAARKIAALHSFVEGMSKQSETFVTQREEEIRTLETKITEARASMDVARQRITHLDASCTAEATRLNQAAEFFSTGAPAPPA